VGDANGGTADHRQHRRSHQRSPISIWTATISFELERSSDGHGGTDITETPGALSGLDSHGDAVEGTTVKASGHRWRRARERRCPLHVETSVDGKHWTTVQDGMGDSYKRPSRTRASSSQVVVTYTDSHSNVEKTTVSAGTVQENPYEHPVILGETNPARHFVEGLGMQASELMLTPFAARSAIRTRMIVCVTGLVSPG